MRDMECGLKILGRNGWLLEVEVKGVVDIEVKG